MSDHHGLPAVPLIVFLVVLAIVTLDRWITGARQASANLADAACEISGEVRHQPAGGCSIPRQSWSITSRLWRLIGIATADLIMTRVADRNLTRIRLERGSSYRRDWPSGRRTTERAIIASPQISSKLVQKIGVTDGLVTPELTW